MSAGAGATRHGARVPWTDAVRPAVTAVSWAFLGTAGKAALGPRPPGAVPAGSPGPVTASVVAPAAGGSVAPCGDVPAFGPSGTEAGTTVEITPPGVSGVGAPPSPYVLLRSPRAADSVSSPGTLVVRAGTAAALFVGMPDGPVRAGRAVVTIGGGTPGRTVRR
uniref:streptophobe family protein n=1 Tax=Streptomyces prasinopilosus TaxID=67344 RepID=UPI000AAA948B